MRSAVTIPLLVAVASVYDLGLRPQRETQEPRWVVSFRGVGPVRFGMSVQQASAAVRERLPGPSPEDTSSNNVHCPFYYATPKATAPGLSFMVQDDTIVRVDIHGGPFATTDGFHTGSTESEIRRRYGDRLEVGNSLGGDELLILSSPDPERRFLIVFEITDGKVSSYRAGRRMAAQLEECS